jgi:phage gpG-like protein
MPGTSSAKQVSGPRLEDLIARINRIGRDEAKKQLNEGIAAEMLRMVKQGFERSTDPYGKPWPPPLLRDGMPLLDTGRLRAAFQVRVGPLRVEIFNNVKYANVQNYGATINAKDAPYLVFKGKGGWYSKKQVVIPKRQMVPDEGDLPDRWRPRLTSVADDIMRKLVVSGR